MNRIELCPFDQHAVGANTMGVESVLDIDYDLLQFRTLTAGQI